MKRFILICLMAFPAQALSNVTATYLEFHPAVTNTNLSQLAPYEIKYFNLYLVVDGTRLLFKTINTWYVSPTGSYYIYWLSKPTGRQCFTLTAVNHFYNEGPESIEGCKPVYPSAPILECV